MAVSKEVLEKAKAKLTELTSDWVDKERGCCYGGTMAVDGSGFQLGHTACHSWVGVQFANISGVASYLPWSDNYKRDAKPFLVLNCYTPLRSQASKEATDAIILWFASEESPFAPFILNRDDPDHLCNSGPILLCGPGGLNQGKAYWMCKVLRYATEGLQSLDTWNTLFKAGVHPLLAVLIASYVPTQKNGLFHKQEVSAHCNVFNNYAAKASFDKKLIAGLMSFTFAERMPSTVSVWSGDPEVMPGAAFTAKSFISPMDKISSFCKPFVKDDGWGGKITGNGATAESFVQSALAWQEELGGYTPGRASKTPSAA